MQEKIVGEIKIFLYDKGSKIDLRDRTVLAELKPTEFHIIPDGAANSAPSLAMVLENRLGEIVVGQISFQMFEPVMTSMITMMMDYLECELKKASIPEDLRRDGEKMVSDIRETTKEMGETIAAKKGSLH